MKFFAPALPSYEKASNAPGLAKFLACFTLGLTRVESMSSIPLPEKDNKLEIQQEQRSSEGTPKSAGDWTSLSRARTLGWTSVLFALLQSLCTAVLTISGIRVAIGLSALAAASGIYAPARGWHQDAIRIPMLIFATIGAIVNLAVIWWIGHLRNRPAAQWRRRETTRKEKRAVRLQVALAIITLILVGLETWTHPLIHRKGPPPPCRIARTC